MMTTNEIIRAVHIIYNATQFLNSGPQLLAVITITADDDDSEVLLTNLEL
jgi:hypothetical protein